jgi:hypothetical protein
MRVTPRPVNYADFYKQYSSVAKSSQALKFKLRAGKKEGRGSRRRDNTLEGKDDEACNLMDVARRGRRRAGR